MPSPQTEVLITVAGAETGRFVLEPGDYVIGRNADCPIRVDADLVSRQHAKLIFNYDHALIEDLGSSNGTQVNGQPIAKDERTRLWPNQKIQIGTATIELRRLKVEVSDMSLAPSAAMVKRVLPEEFLREKKYDIGKVVAQGGMGAILNAREATIERTVAMKVMLDSNDADGLARCAQRHLQPRRDPLRDPLPARPRHRQGRVGGRRQSRARRDRAAGRARKRRGLG